MTRDQLWQLYCARNPQFAREDANVTLTARGLRKLFEQTWDIASREVRPGDAIANFFASAASAVRPAPR